jgi:hypothetical protein
MTKIVVSLVVPFTFSDEGEYHIRLSRRTCFIKIIIFCVSKVESFHVIWLGDGLVPLVLY